MRRKFHRHRGVSALQLLFVLPLLVIAVVAVVQFALVLLVQCTVHSAAATGARIAARGGDAQDVAEAVDEILATRGLRLSAGDGVEAAGLGNDNGNVVVCIQQKGKTGAAGGESHRQLVGNPAIPFTPCPVQLQSGEVMVSVCVSASGVHGDQIPSWLDFVGISMAGRTFEARSLLNLE